MKQAFKERLARYCDQLTIVNLKSLETNLKREPILEVCRQLADDDTPSLSPLGKDLILVRMFLCG